MRRRDLIATAGLLAAVRPAMGQDRPRYFRIATGPTTGTYFVIGGLLAELVSAPAGSRPCDRGGSCGVANLVAVAQTTAGSVANVNLLETGSADSAFVQSDVAYWAYTGTEVFAHGRPRADLRALAALYRESVHVIARADGGVASLADLRGRRVGLDRVGSGTLVDARMVLEAHGLGEADLVAVHQTPAASLDGLRAGRLDAFFLVAGWPAPAVTELVADPGLRLVPIAGPPAERLLSTNPFFTRDLIPAGAYGPLAATPTIGVRALWLVSRALPRELAFALTASLWHPTVQERLRAGHPRGADIAIGTALDGIALPVHPGAAQFYREQGVRAPEVTAPDRARAN